MRFILDRMLGNLASWLRILGYDTEYGELEDMELIRRAEIQGKILITRDKQLASMAAHRGIRAVLIKSGDTRSQLLELGSELNLEFEPKMDRCSICNGKLSKLKDLDLLRDARYGYVPKSSGKEFWICCNCGQVFWQGSHWKWIRKLCSQLSSSLGKP